ncbi:MAG: DoxX family protein [Thiolinea sp.]
MWVFGLEWLRVFDFLAPVAIRLLLVPVFWVSGVQRLGLFSRPDWTWFDPLTWVNSETLQASAAQMSSTLINGVGAETLALSIGILEVAGAILLILGFAVRWIVPVLMLVLVWLIVMNGGDAGLAAQARQLVMEHGYVTLQNSRLEVYVTYLVLLLALFFMGAGRWFSLDWFVYRRFMRNVDRRESMRYEGTDPFEIDATDEPGVAPRARPFNVRS